MIPRQIDRFFRTLAKEFQQPATIILTGAAAGSLWGHIRPSLDIDFAVKPLSPNPASWEQIERAIERTVRLTGIHVNYAEDIDRWSSISLLDYQRHTRPYRRFGGLQVRLLDPAYWSIGKIGRYLDPDVHDVVEVFKRQHVPFVRILRLWARAVRESPRSPALTQFCKQAEHFLQAYGRHIWGKSFDPTRAIEQFRQELRQTTPTTD